MMDTITLDASTSPASIKGSADPAVSSGRRPPTEQAIRERAYAIWEEEGCPDGNHLEHWRRAEDEINSADEAGENKTP